jgi:hypothetical protein
MPVSLEFLRGVLGILGVGCAYMAGRSVAAVRRGWLRPPKVYGWILRTVLCLVAIVTRHSVDGIAEVVFLVALVAFAAAYWQTMQRKPPEDLSSEIFPHES